MKCHLIIWIILAVGSCWNNLYLKKYPHALLLKRKHYFILTMAKKQDWIKREFQVRVWYKFKKLRVSQRFQPCWNPPPVLFFPAFLGQDVLYLYQIPFSGKPTPSRFWTQTRSKCLNQSQMGLISNCILNCERIYQGSPSLSPPLPGHFIPIFSCWGKSRVTHSYRLLGWKFSLCTTKYKHEGSRIHVQGVIQFLNYIHLDLQLNEVKTGSGSI